MRMIELDEIERALESADLTAAIEESFVAYSTGRAVVPPVGELLFDQPPGEVHIKYGYLRGDDFYVVKIASGFYENPALGLPSGDGLMLLFEQRTGQPVALLADRGRLTDYRTAVAGAVAARSLAPETVQGIGILGTGVQARLQLRMLADVVDCRRAMVWGRRTEAAVAYAEEMGAYGFEISVAASPSEVAAASDLIVTVTPSRVPLLGPADVESGTHITAVGSDTPGKQELDSGILARADVVVVDSISQCRERGELAPALAAGALEESGVRELGEILAGRATGRTAESQITVADLTGLATQDVQAAKAIFEAVTG